MNMEEEELDTHICLVCHTTVIGLDCYVRHKKKECSGRKTESSSRAIDVKASDEDVNTATSIVTTAYTPTKEQTSVSHSTPLVSTLPVKNSLMSPTTSRTIESNIMIYDDASPKDISITDFLSSLELQSRGTTVDQNKGNKDSPATVKSPNTEDRLDDHKSLRIASILNDLAFSDDDDDANEDDLSNIDADNLMALVEEDDQQHPPRSHTGGKWRPGSAPPSGGKWKPSSKLLAMSKHRQSQTKSSAGKRMPGESLPYSSYKNNSEQNAEQKNSDNNDKKQLLNSEGQDYHCDKLIPEYTCSACNRSFKSEVGLRRHMLTNYHRKRVTNVQSDAKPEKVETTTNSTDDTVILECPSCDKQFNSKYNFARHLVSTYHQKRTGKNTHQLLLNENMQTILLRQNPYQCRVCNFYCIEHKVFLDHLQHKVHRHKVSMLIGPLLCQICKFYTRDSYHMVEHFKEKEHLVRKSERLCIVKEKRHKIKCPNCSLLVHSATALKRHIKFAHHSGDKCINRSEKGVHIRPVCPYCDLQCRSNSALALHVRRVHIREKRFKCDTCQRAFSDGHTLSLHKQSRYHYRRAADAAGVTLHKYLEDAKNNDTMRISASAVLNDLHRNQAKTAENPGEEFDCNTCGMTFSSVQNLKTHIASARHKKMMDIGDRESIVQCQTCNQKFESPHSYVNHQLKVHLNFVKPDRTSAKHVGISEKYMEFVYNMEKSRKKIVQCPECDKRMTSGNIYVHLRNHSNSKPFDCELCNMKFSDPVLLKQHIVNLHIRIKFYSCPQCGKSYSRSSHYHRHIKSAHGDPENTEQYPCKTCGKIFKDIRKVHQHEQAVHYVRSCVCQWKGCHMRFSMPYALKIHMRTHTGEKPYLCQLCGYSCPDASGMARHKRTHRAREYPCDYCTYKGTTKAHLRRHLRIHIGSKPYKCLHCDYKCKSVENLRSHCMNTKVHPGKSMYPCKHCPYGTHSAKEMQKHLFVTHAVSVENDKNVGIYLGTYDKSEDPDALPEGSCALPIMERKRLAKRPLLSDTDDLNSLGASEQLVAVILKTDDDENKQHEEVLANFVITNNESVNELFKTVEVKAEEVTKDAANEVDAVVSGYRNKVTKS